MYISKIYSKNLWIWVLAFFFFSCQSDTPILDEEEQEVENRYQFNAPKHFPDPTYTFENNPIARESFEIGKKLFFDPILSRDGSVSCNNCHQQGLAFADNPLHPFSVGVEDRLGERNAPSLANMAFYPEFFWDGGVTHLDFTPINAITAHFEMDNTMEVVIRRLNNNDEYKKLFKEAFDKDKITSPYMLHSLSQYMFMMISDNSKYDQYLRGEIKLSPSELAGKKVFERKCGHCHDGTLQTDFSYRNNGLDSAFVDLGRGRITEVATDYGKFRVPSLRNVELTAPYMHNARFKTLEDVIEHYRNGIVSSQTLDKSLQNRIDISNTEQKQIIDFLHTLTDETFVRDTLFMRR